MGDLTRGAVLFKTQHEVDRYVDHLRRRHGDRIVDYEHKARGGDPQFGYHGSHHFTIRNPSGVNSELQVMTHRLWNYKDAAHEIYNQNRTNPAKTPTSQKQTSKSLFARGNQPIRKKVVPRYRLKAKAQTKKRYE